MPNLLLAAFAVSLPTIQDEPPKPEVRQEVFVAPASDEARVAMAAFQPAPGLQLELVAAEPDVCNIVAFDVDDRGRIWVAETFRINDGVFDTRNFMHWKDEDLACLTVADRLAKYQRHIADKFPHYAKFPERIRLLRDDNGDGRPDRSTVFADQFTELADGIASGVLAHGDDVYFANIPKLWRLRDRDGDGIADERTALHDGYGVHTSLIGHDLHGLVIGPDRRLWFSIGDRGFHVQQGDKTFAYPHEGAVLRCELDGSDLEVVHRGLRNPQELAFDDFGNLFTGDNNSDGGDRARLVQIVAGGDSGWRIGYQWLDDRGAWNRERIWWPQHPGQPAAYLPPIANFADGPSGLAYDPGTGLPERYRGHFFLCDFRGSSASSGVHALQLAPRGAGFELVRTERVIWRVLATDIAFAPDGSLLVSDWVDGWNKSGKGRIYALRSAGTDDFAARTTARLLGEDFGARSDAQLAELLRHKDRRVRQKAQFALVDHKAVTALAAAAGDRDHRLARIAAIFGLGVLGRKDPAVLSHVRELLKDGDAEVRARAAWVLGDCRDQNSVTPLVKLLQDGSARVQMHAALAIARLGQGTNGTSELIELLRQNDGRDPVLRHATSFALAHRAHDKHLADAVADPSPAVRLGVVLAMRHRADPKLAELLDDPVPAVQVEAARAIYEAPVAAAMPALAGILPKRPERQRKPNFPSGHETPEPASPPYPPSLLWRALNAARLLGTIDNAETVRSFADDEARPEDLRCEALAILAEWPRPHGQDRVVGNWRTAAPHADLAPIADSVARTSQDLLSHVEDVAIAAADTIARLGLSQCSGGLAAVIGTGNRPVAVRVAALRALASLQASELGACVDNITAADPGPLRQEAVKLLSRRSPDAAVPMLATLLENGSRNERRGALQALGEIQHGASATLLGAWLDRLDAGNVPPPLQLELLEAADRHEALRERLRARTAKLAADPVAANAASLHGGDSGTGRHLFFHDERARCQRCHAINGRGGNAAPKLDGVGKRLSREQILQSMLAPSAAIAEGFHTAVLTLTNGDLAAGIVVRDGTDAVELADIDGKITKIPVAQIAQRTSSPTSSMPSMTGVLNPRELRDLVEFLAGLR